MEFKDKVIYLACKVDKEPGENDNLIRATTTDGTVVWIKKADIVEDTVNGLFIK